MAMNKSLVCMVCIALVALSLSVPRVNGQDPEEEFLLAGAGPSSSMTTTSGSASVSTGPGLISRPARLPVEPTIAVLASAPAPASPLSSSGPISQQALSGPAPAPEFDDFESLPAPTPPTSVGDFEAYPDTASIGAYQEVIPVPHGGETTAALKAKTSGLKAPKFEDFQAVPSTSG